MNIRDLAARLGVSPATVSLALNNKSGVSTKTRDRVLKAANELHYVKPQQAQNQHILFIKYRKHGMLVEENAGFIATILDAIEAHCRQLGYQLAIQVIEDHLADEIKNIPYSKYVGAIFLGTELSQEEYPLLENIPIPYIVVDNNMPHFPCQAITLDNEELVYQALSYLLILGHRKLIYYKSKTETQNFWERTQAVYRLAAELGMEVVEEIALTPTLMTAFEEAGEIFAQRKRLPSAAFADNDTLAIGVIKALKKAGYKVPEDISIIGIDDIPFSRINSPPLTTVMVYKKDIGILTVDHLHRLITTNVLCPRKTRVGGILVKRQSTDRYDI